MFPRKLFSRPNRRLGLAVTALAASHIAVAADERERRLTDLVRQDCGSCHGLTLKGGLGRAIRPQDLAHFDTATLVAVILDGIPGTPMPPWRGLMPAEDARWIAEKLKEGLPP
jgi:cytochrome c55X